jgi:hypothetical protein
VRNLISPHPNPLPAGEGMTAEQIIPENTNLKNTIVELIFSNSRLAGIEKILKSLIEYPY